MLPASLQLGMLVQIRRFIQVCTQEIRHRGLDRESSRSVPGTGARVQASVERGKCGKNGHGIWVWKEWQCRGRESVPRGGAQGKGSGGLRTDGAVAEQGW